MSAESPERCEIEHVAPGEQAREVRAGDFILCHRRGLASSLIRLGERLRLHGGEVSHAAFCMSEDELIEALTRGVTRTPLSAYREIEYWHVRTGLCDQDAAQALAFALSCVGQRYGWVTIAGIALRFLTPGRGLWFGANGTEICSGLVAQSQVRGWVNYAGDPASLTPQELLDFYRRRAA